MLSYWRFYFTLLIPVLAFYAIADGGWLVWAVPVWSFVILPIADHLVGTNTKNPTPEQEASFKNSGKYDFLVQVWPFIQIPLLLYGLYSLSHHSYTLNETIGIVFSLGIVTGAFGITWAHELCHRISKWERFLAEILLTSVAYAHFSVEHVYGHHRRVGTPEDPATSRLGESLYHFLPRTFFGSYISAWQIEVAEQAKKKLPFVHFKNRMLRYLIVQLGVVIAIYLWLGSIGLAFYLCQAAIAILLLEIINYIEHYGLQRDRKDNGRYEKVQPWHSWNAAHEMSNLALINLARHSDHHYLASRPYQLLRHYDDVPQMPTGYSGMVLLALIPPLWFKVMNPRVAAWRSAE